MNTANLQLEGLYAALSALMTAMRQNGVLSEAEIESALGDAEDTVTSDRSRVGDLSPAHLDAIAFPLRYLRLANKHGAAGSYRGFAELTAQIGREKPQNRDLLLMEREDIETSEDEDVRRLERENGTLR